MTKGEWFDRMIKHSSRGEPKGSAKERRKSAALKRNANRKKRCGGKNPDRQKKRC